MFSLHDDDEGDFSLSQPASSSKLASLFGVGQAPLDGGNSSLTYTAPKQPQAKDQTAAEGKIAESKSNEPSLLHVVVVHAFRFLNGQYVKQGKLGAAILGSHTDKEYKLLLYVSQKQPVASAKIGPSFSFTAQKNNYSSFYDDQGQMWSICFDNCKALAEFSKWLSFSKLKSSNGNPTLVVQDVLHGEGQALQKGDLLETQYTGWLMMANTIGKVFDTNVSSGKTFKVKLGKGKVIRGWEEGIVGMRKGGKRILAIPSSMAYGLKGVPSQIPPSCELLFEIDVKRIKFSNTEAADEPDMSRSDGPSKSTMPNEKVNVLATPDAQLPRLKDDKTGSDVPSSQMESIQDEPSRARSASSGSFKELSHSISEKSSKVGDGGSEKSHLLARMSKMGQAMLPGSADVESAVMDNEAVEAESIKRAKCEEKGRLSRSNSNSSSSPDPSQRPAVHPKPEGLPRATGERPRSRTSSHNEATQAATSSQYAHHYSHGPSNPAVNLVGHRNDSLLVQQPVAVYQPPASTMYSLSGQGFASSTLHHLPSTPEFNLIMTENRLLTTETRAAVGKVSEKVEEVLSKVKLLETSVLGNAHHLVASNRGPTLDFDPTMLAQSIAKMAQENELLKKECSEKTAKIETLTEKISDLLHRNQQFLEKSNFLMEERADSIEEKSAGSSSKLLSLQEKNAALEAELNSAQVKLTTYQTQLQMSEQDKEEALIDANKLKCTVDRLKQQLSSSHSNATESETERSELMASLKEYKKETRKLKLQQDHFEEEILDVKQENDSLKKSIEDRKRKLIAVKATANEELEQLKVATEAEIAAVKAAMLKSGDGGEQLLEMEARLNVKWEAKLEDELLCWRNAVSRLEVDNSRLEAMTKQSMSKPPEDQQDKETDEKAQEQAITKAYEEGFGAGKASVSQDSSGLSQQVKSIMNRLFLTLRNEFDDDESFTGKEVTSVMLDVIKDVTLGSMNKLQKCEDHQVESTDEEVTCTVVGPSSQEA